MLGFVLGVDETDRVIVGLVFVAEGPVIIELDVKGVTWHGDPTRSVP